MPKDLLTRINWDLIYPPFRDKCFELAARCRALGSDYFAISGYRSFPEQARLYFQGRTRPGRVVTNARPGFSAHNYGVGVDWCKDTDVERAGLQPDWDLPDYELLRVEAERLELESGMSWASFREGPHVQLPLPRKGLTFDLLKKAHNAGGLAEVWSLLDSHGPW